MGQGVSSRFSRIAETAIEGDLSSGPFEFELNGNSARNNILDYLYFVDSNNDPVDATGGTVKVTLSPILPIFQSISDGIFLADTARGIDWPKPNGFGKAIAIKFTFTGITGAPTGFRAHVTQSVS